MPMQLLEYDQQRLNALLPRGDCNGAANSSLAHIRIHSPPRKPLPAAHSNYNSNYSHAGPQLAPTTQGRCRCISSSTPARVLQQTPATSKTSVPPVSQGEKAWCDIYGVDYEKQIQEALHESPSRSTTLNPAVKAQSKTDLKMQLDSTRIRGCTRSFHERVQPLNVPRYFVVPPTSPGG
ncbi:hypothetical protein PHYSODRAFT_338119 [Phytophthora sojae]|uniref:Uncharacterized protein n=1 Tax=Phytophthora sojae (strain P6497) TaxID=1094619 RepID=G5A0S1_PHYSP|nr:hypothetical protein PHYSODRAFT_338119 [Phytophthora sojae]EGZ11407.1 hypothetical protein PHYSODRAFT_338119 [Phytophthora sojae]|eukprot:XP_009534152.1 hypothetical protein PHYSODRAFT_338119 [Phytophthora sojae]